MLFPLPRLGYSVHVYSDGTRGQSQQKHKRRDRVHKPAQTICKILISNSEVGAGNMELPAGTAATISTVTTENFNGFEDASGAVCIRLLKSVVPF